MRIGLRHLTDPSLDAHVEESRAFNAAREASGPKRGPANADELAIARWAAPRVAPSDRVDERTAHAGDHRVPVRVIRPTSSRSRGVVLDIHGGGFYLGFAGRGDARNIRLADALNVTVVSVEYRLAPENPWPAAPDDVATAARWILDDAEGLRGDTPLVLAGSSAGANLAMTTLFRLREHDRLAPVAGAVLRFGAYDLSGQTPEGRRYADEWFIPTYVGHVADRTVPDISPIFGDLHGLPPTLVVVGDRDEILDDSLAMAARLATAGNDVDLRVFPESVHGFTGFPTAMAAAAEEQTNRWIDDRLNDRGVPALG